MCVFRNYFRFGSVLEEIISVLTQSKRKLFRFDSVSEEIISVLTRSQLEEPIITNRTMYDAFGLKTL
jgi:hypothetical protein